MIKVVIALVLLAHGIGHSIGIVGEVKLATISPGWDGSSWALTRFAGPTLTGAVGIALWAIALVGFVAVAAILWGWLPAAWWQPVVVVASLASLAGLLVFPSAFPTTSTIGALAVDVAVLGAVFLMHWQPTDAIG